VGVDVFNGLTAVHVASSVDQRYSYLVIGKVFAVAAAETIVTSLPEAVHVGAAATDGPENAVVETVPVAVCISGGINDNPGKG
jgi:hypothetical protein